MLKFPLLRSKLEKPAALLLFGALLSLGISDMRALAGEKGAQQAPAAGSEAAVAGTGEKPALENKTPESTQAPSPENASAAPDDAGPAGTKAAEAEARAKPAGSAGPQAPVEAGAKPANAKPASAEQKADGSKEAAAAGEPKEAQKQTRAKKAGADGQPKETQKRAAAKEAGTNGKPRDLTPKPDGGRTVAVRPSKVKALYRIHFLGAYIGDFEIRSSITAQQYSIKASADISVFFGAFHWKGATRSSGLMTVNGPVPLNYTFRYSTNKKREAVELRFQQKMVSDIIVNPPYHPSSRAVPITAADLQNVLDPASAIVLLAQMRPSLLNGGDPCNKRLPIFDGKIRYDLVLSPKGRRSIGNGGRLRGIAHVCRVAYIQLAGHKPGKSGNYASRNSGIEIWLVPVRQAGLLVPYYIQVPTPAGKASMVSAKFDVQTSAGRHALAD
jgi:hypothetical protein